MIIAKNYGKNCKKYEISFTSRDTWIAKTRFYVCLACWLAVQNITLECVSSDQHIFRLNSSLTGHSDIPTFPDIQG